MATGDGAVRCQRIGCDAMFTEEDNADGSCRYHDSGVSEFQYLRVFLGLHHHALNPIFHDGMKEWSCCKQRSHDFSLFLAIPGCKTGTHTTEKPVTKIVSANPPKPVPVQSPAQSMNSEDSCSRCRQGFFCSDHGSKGRPSKPAAATSATDNPAENEPAPVKKRVGINEPQTCRNKGCGKTFKEKDNHETACEYHPGPAVFHDRLRGWKCCDVHVKEFDEFLSIPPCARGWHNADAA